MSPQPRKDDVAQERRRRQPGTLDRGQQLKLAIPSTVSEKYPDYTFRWVNDAGNRIHALTVMDDWEKVPEVQPMPVGTDKEGKPVMGYLCMKKRDFFEHDQREKLDGIKAREAALVRQPDSPPDAGSYALSGNSITPGYKP